MTGRPRGLRPSITLRTVIGVATVAVLFVAVVPHGAAAPKASKACNGKDGKYVVGRGWEQSPAPGIEVVAASDEEVVFTVAEDSALIELCVKTGKELDNYISDATLPVQGPATVTITKAGPGLGIGQLSFDTESSRRTDRSASPLTRERRTYTRRRTRSPERVTSRSDTSTRR